MSVRAEAAALYDATPGIMIVTKNHEERRAHWQRLPADVRAEWVRLAKAARLPPSRKRVRR